MIRFGIFLIVLGVCALIAWVGGYNFDTRGVDEAYWTVMALVAAIVVASCPYFDQKGK